jgi:hypothetical protein
MIREARAGGQGSEGMRGNARSPCPLRYNLRFDSTH